MAIVHDSASAMPMYCAINVRPPKIRYSADDQATHCANTLMRTGTARVCRYDNATPNGFCSQVRVNSQRYSRSELRA